MGNDTLPEDWEATTLGELFDFSNGVNADKTAYGRGIPFVNVLEIITHEALVEGLIPGRITLLADMTTRYCVRYGDVLFNRTSETQEEVGLASVYVGHAPVVFGGFVFRARPKTNRLEVGYSKYALQVHSVREQIIARGQGGIRSNIGQRDLKTVYVVLPPAGEQRAIAQVLDDADKLVATLEQLIAKKQAIKQGIMQHLFTSHVDRRDFVPLRSVTSWLSGGTPNRSNASYWSGTIPWISATTLKKLEVATSDQAVTPAAVTAGSKMAPLGSTLLLVRGSALHSEIRASLVTSPVCFNQDVKALVPSQALIPKFLTYLIHGNADRLLRLVTSAGNTAGVLDTQVAKSFEVWIPSRTEQQHVVTVLDDTFRELETLQSRLVKAKAVKQGMMQELLTGRTRLPATEAAHE